MGAVTQITQFLYENDPRKCMSHLCLYHYLKNSVDADREFDQFLVNEFVDDTLRFEYWQSHQSDLIADLEALFRQLSKKRILSEAQIGYLPTTSRQLVLLENEQDFVFQLQHSIDGSEVRDFSILPHISAHKLVLSLLKTGGLRAEVYQPKARIEKGELQLLQPITQLLYDSGMELEPNLTQKLSLNGLQTLYFRKHHSRFLGRTVQGHLFKIVSQLDTQHFSSYSEGFSSIKEIEKHFIEPSSDPYYQELVDVLEKAYHLLHSGRGEAPQFAPRALARGREALQTIYPKDKLLLLLVTNIEYLLRPGQKQVDSPKSSQERKNWQKAKPLPL